MDAVLIGVETQAVSTGIPDSLWQLFGVGYLGYAGSRTYEKHSDNKVKIAKPPRFRRRAASDTPMPSCTSIFMRVARRLAKRYAWCGRALAKTATTQVSRDPDR